MEGLQLLERSWSNGELLSFTSDSGLWLDGLLYGHPGYRGIVLHVHGSFGNFYSNRWLRPMARAYAERGYAFLPFNLTCHDGVAEGYRQIHESDRPEFEYTGFSVSDFSSALDDIAGALSACNDLGYPANKVVLQGHSMGCDRVVAHARATGFSGPLVLLSPADSVVLRRRDLERRGLPIDETYVPPSSIVSGPHDWLATGEYRVSEPNESYDIPITAHALEGLFVRSRGILFDYSKTHDYELGNAAYIFLGGKDGYNVWPVQRVREYFAQHLGEVEFDYRHGSDHELRSQSEDIAGRVAKWLTTLEDNT